MPKAISYIRFSSEKQAKGSSLERQQTMLAQWLDSNPEYVLSDLRFQDLGVSGFTGAHLENGFGQLLAAVENGSIEPGDVVLIEAIDRVGRLEPMEMLPLLARIVRTGVYIVTLDDGIKYDRESANSNHLFLLVAKVQQAHQYSETLSRRLKASYAARRKNAVEGVVPKRHTPVWLTSEGELISEIAPLVKQAFEDYASGIGERRIFERIFKGNSNPLLARMAPSTVKRWMNNRTAIGEWDSIPNVYPAVVEPELFYRVQKRMEAKFSPRGTPNKHAYTGLVVCSECGKNFNTKYFKASDQTSMECSSRARRGAMGCSNNRSMPEPVIKLAYLFTFTGHALKALEGQMLTASQKRAMELEGEIGEVNKKITRIVNAITVLEDDSEELTDKLRSLQAERKLLQAEMNGLTHTSISIRDKILSTTEFNKDMMKANALLQSVGYQLVCHPDGRITFEDETGKQTFHYLGWGRSEDVHKVVLSDGKLVKLGITRPENKLVKKTVKATPVDIAAIKGMKLSQIKVRWDKK